jgi:hypothetical protein
MNKNPARRFDKRAFIVGMLAITGLGLPVTGVANHLYQSARLDLARHSWMAAHNALGLLFVVFTLWHASLHWRPLVRYVKGSIASGQAVSRELLLASALAASVLTMFIGHAWVV